MNNIIDFYSERNVVFIESEKFADLSSLPDYQFRNLVVIGISAKGRKGWMDFGALCYAKRTIADSKTHASKVVISTLDPTIEKAFDLFAKSKLSTISPSSVSYYRAELKDFSNYYFENLSQLDFNNYDDCCIAYEQYTQKLLTKKAELLSSVKTTGFTALANRQHVFAELICLFHNKDLQKFKSTYVTLNRTRDQQHKQAVTLQKLSNFYDFNKKLFYALRDFLINRKQHPFLFSSSEQEKPQIVHYPHASFIQKMRNKLFNEDGFLKNKTEFQKVIDEVNEPLLRMDIQGHKKHYEKMYDCFNEWIIQSQQNKSRDKAVLINYAIAAFAMCLYCESSINSSQLYGLKIDDLSDFKPSIKGMKLCVTKPRANYKATELLIAAPMLPLIEDYKEFRFWVLSLTGDKNNKSLLFSLNTKLGQTSDCFETVNSFSGSQQLNLRRWIVGFIPDFEWINPTIIRKTTSTIFYNKTKSALITSKKLGNTPNIVSRHYIEASEEEFVEQVSHFFGSLHDQIANKYRKNNDVISVNINEASKETPVGGCKNSIPKLHNGFTKELEKPNCSNPSSCLFCENYVVHSDQEDIRKLMSLKKILNMSDKNDEALVITKRINEILKILYDKYPEKKEDFISVAQSIEIGEFDEYWQDHLKLLIDLGVNFYG